MHSFIYLFICGAISFPFCPGDVCAFSAHGVVLVYMCYSCSNIVVVSIHIHAFKKAGCVHGSVVSPIMLPSYSDHRQRYPIMFAWEVLDICVHRCVCVCVCLYKRMPFTLGSLLVLRSWRDFLRRTRLSFSARLFQHLLAWARCHRCLLSDVIGTT